MRLSIPIFVETTGSENSSKTNYVVRPLFHYFRPAVHPLLSQAKAALQRDLRQQLSPLAVEQRHDELAKWSYHPELQARVFTGELELRDKRIKVKFPLITFAGLGRLLAFCPKLPDLWFELSEEDDFDARAREVFVRHFRELDRAGGAEATADAVSLKGKMWTATIEVELPSEQRVAKQENPWAALWNDQPLDGAEELHRVGRHLDALYPDALPRAVRREREAGELDRWLSASDRRPVVIVGPRLVGKSALIYEVVRRRVERKLAQPERTPGVKEEQAKKKSRKHDDQTWLLSPQRLVSGMSYVGQWENRLTAIIKHAEKHDHLLYFDNFLGLYQAGQSRDASLSMADVLRTFVQDRRVRVLTEMTPEAFHIWQERDRGLADQFHVLRLNETNDEETLRILLSIVRELEAFHRTKFVRGVVPAIVEIQRRYAPDAAFPGKAAAVLRQLATKYGAATVETPKVYDEFHAQTGLALGMLDGRELDANQVRHALERSVVGQTAALQASVDVVSLAKARLTSQQRPLASLLFLGPTGVGKTQCAKALAEYLFSDADKVLRFDMNEYASSAAVARLVGTAADPEGLLTSAVRRRPFCVVLLDEIEKAHPDVFDLLLQVTGEARLTDALGRTTDFSNAILILTSNLGAREAASSLGFNSDSSRDSVYVSAAERFFRPEFFNRLDRVVPFQRLAAGEIRRIADHQLRDLFKRDGLTRRNCVLEVTSEALDAVAQRGFHPQYGARALKRSVEQSIARPLAARLTSLDPELPVLVSLHRRRGEPTLHVQSLSPAASLPLVALPAAPLEAVVRLQQALATVERTLTTSRPDGSSSDYKRQGDYYVLREALAEFGAELKAFAESLDPARQGREAPMIGTHARARRTFRTQSARSLPSRSPNARQLLREGLSAEDINEYVEEQAAARTPSESEAESRLLEFRRRLTLFAAAVDPRWSEGAVLIFSPTTKSHRFAGYASTVFRFYTLILKKLDVEAQEVPLPGAPTSTDDAFNVLAVGGRIGAAIAAREMGLHLFPIEGEGLAAIRLTALPIEPGETPAAAAQRFRQRKAEWMQAVDEGRQEPGDDPFPPGEVLRTYQSHRVIDLRTARSTVKLDVESLTSVIIDGLPDPLATE